MFENVTQKRVRVSNAVAAGTTEIDATGVDMAGFDAVTFEVLFGAITGGAVTAVKAQQSDDNGSSDSWNDLSGASVTVADTDDNKVALLTVLRPAKRYVRCVVTRSTQNAVVDGIVAVLFQPKSAPTAVDATTITPVVVVTPAEA